MSMEMADEYRVKESMYRKCSFIALKIAISLPLLKDSTIFIQSIFLQLELCLCLFLRKENLSYWGTVATKCTTVAWITYK